jgi:cytoskeletal protein CcmA (bactofilin family)
MHAISVIGPSIQITGSVSSQEPLTIAGRLQGSVEIPGHTLTVGATAHIDGDITAEAMVIEGHVHGTLHASARIVVTATATIEGDVSSPALSVAAGAILQGQVEVDGRRSAALKLAS